MIRCVSRLPSVLLAVFALTSWIGCAQSHAPAGDKRFVTLAPGARLPTEAECASRVRIATETRPANAAANQAVGTTVDAIDGAAAEWSAAHHWRVSGNFTGTTDEILQWAACKWGFDEDITRARAVQESHWHMDYLGDRSEDAAQCQTIEQPAPCYQSYGLLQVKGTVHDGTYPHSARSTAFNVDYALAWTRACYEGAFSHWLPEPYAAGDEWGCVGAWFSGRFKDEAALDYIGKVRRHLDDRTWESGRFRRHRSPFAAE